MPIDFRAATLNVLGRRFDYARTWGQRLPRLVNRLTRVLDDKTDAAASVYLLTECGAQDAADLAKRLGLKAHTYLGVSILHGPAWTPGKRWTKTWLGNTHGALVLELTRDGQTVNVCVNHLPPFPWRAALRKRQLAELLAMFKGWRDPVLVGGDFNWGKGAEAAAAAQGFQSTRLRADTRQRADYRTSGAWKPGQPIDYLLSRGLTQRAYRVLQGVDPVSRKLATDHHLVVGHYRAEGK